MPLPEWNTEQELEHFFATIERDFDIQTAAKCREILQAQPGLRSRPFKALGMYLDSLNADELVEAATYRELASNS